MKDCMARTVATASEGGDSGAVGGKTRGGQRAAERRSRAAGEDRRDGKR